jgi:hypothetical protein
MLTMTYRIKKGNKISKKLFTSKGAKEIKKKYAEKNISVEIVPFKEVLILDWVNVGEVGYYWEPR